MYRMFCNQCEACTDGVACRVFGACGKNPDLSALMDLLVYTVLGVSICNSTLRTIKMSLPLADMYIRKSLMLTMTNMNFDRDTIVHAITEGVQLRNLLIKHADTHGLRLPDVDHLVWYVPAEDYLEKARSLSFPDSTSSEEEEFYPLILYTLKGIMAMVQPIAKLSREPASINAELQSIVGELCYKRMGVEALLSVLMRLGHLVYQTMRILNYFRRSLFGAPVCVKVNGKCGHRSGILVTGTDYGVLRELLRQVKNKDIDVYSHDELVGAHAYPQFHKYRNFIGNYGESWVKQRMDFLHFNGPVLFTSNNILLSQEGELTGRMYYVTNLCDFPGAKKIPVGENGKLDFSPLLADCSRYAVPDSGMDSVLYENLSTAEMATVVSEIATGLKANTVSRVVFIVGTDTAANKGDYYRDFVEACPDTIVLITAGSIKYRLLNCVMGKVGGVPRHIDFGQLSDTFKLVDFIYRLKTEMGVAHLKDLPIAFLYSWFEQESIATLQMLLSKNIPRILLGPSWPPFISPSLREHYSRIVDLHLIGTAKGDVAKVYE